MKYSYALALATAQLAYGHTTFQSFIVGGKEVGLDTIRKPSNGNNPITDVTSTLMNCNGGAAAASTFEVASGSKLTFQWHHNVCTLQSHFQRFHANDHADRCSHW